MPLVYQQNINEATKLAVWHIGETEDFFLKTVPLQKEITHPNKRLQHLAGRYLLRELFEDFPLELIKIADTKKPFLSDEAYHFSISHCGDYAAAIVSTANRVGVDIEIVSEKVQRIRDKFLSVSEQKLIQDICTAQNEALPAETELLYFNMLTLAWSIKETMFKWNGAALVDFRKHMHINQLDVNDNDFLAHCSFSKNESIQLKVHGLMFNSNTLTWLVT